MNGDFNMIEDFGDRIGGSHALIGATELITWKRLCLSFRLQDAWHVSSFGRFKNSLSFSRSYRRQQGVHLSRLDRIYIDDFFVRKGGGICIISSSLFSDHAPVIMVAGKQPYHNNSCRHILK